MIAQIIAYDATTKALTLQLDNGEIISTQTEQNLASYLQYHGFYENGYFVLANISAPSAGMDAPTATSDFLVGAQVASVWVWVKKTLVQVKTILGLGSAAYTASSDYAVAAKGVTNGDSHNHAGGDGAQIAYTDLSALPSAETQTNDIFRCDSPGAASGWTGTFTAAGSSGSTIKYSTTSGAAACMTPYSTSHLGKMRLYNTTRGNYVLISNHVAGTITSTANYPAGWVNGDVLTIASQTVTGAFGTMLDIEIASGPTGKAFMFLIALIQSATVGDRLTLHPTEAFAASKYKNLFAQAANINIETARLVKITSNLFSLAWSGTPTVVLVREEGYLS